MNVLKREITDEGFLLGLIPQRKPFIMVDKLIHYSENKIISGLTITKHNILASDTHFSAPGLIENMAQTTALHTGYKFYLKNQPAPLGYIGAIKKAEILDIPKISQKLITTVEILHDIMNITLVKAKIECGGRLIARSEMKTALA